MPYEKGFALLCHLRDCVVETAYTDAYDDDDARHAALDPWLRRYLSDFAFRCVSARDMLAHFRAFHPRAFAVVAWPDWLDAEGLCPEGFVPPTPAAATLAAPADALAARVAAGDAAAAADVGAAWPAWPTYQRSYFLDDLVGRDAPLAPDVLYALGRACGLSETRNAELTMRWALLVLKEALELRDDDVDRHLDLTAKQKFVLPVFRALHAVDAKRAAAALARIRKGLDSGVRKKLDKIVAAGSDAPLAASASAAPCRPRPRSSRTRGPRPSRRSRATRSPAPTAAPRARPRTAQPPATRRPSAATSSSAARVPCPGASADRTAPCRPPCAAARPRHRPPPPPPR